MTKNERFLAFPWTQRRLIPINSLSPSAPDSSFPLEGEARRNRASGRDVAPDDARPAPWRRAAKFVTPDFVLQQEEERGWQTTAMTGGCETAGRTRKSSPKRGEDPTRLCGCSLRPSLCPALSLPVEVSPRRPRLGAAREENLFGRARRSDWTVPCFRPPPTARHGRGPPDRRNHGGYRFRWSQRLL